MSSVPTKKIIARLRDKGCIENVLPVAIALHELGHDVCMYLDEGNTLARKVFGGSSMGTVDYIQRDAIVISCLPLGRGFDAIEESGASIILIQENPDWHDDRFQIWVSLETIAQICTISEASTHSHPATLVTGLPTIDIAAINVATIDQKSLMVRMGFAESKSVIALALPGDTVGCMRMLNTFQNPSALRFHAVARSHPKLKMDDPEGYQLVHKLVLDMFNVNLDDMNADITSDEAISLSCGDGNFFVTTHNSSLAWQAAGAGVENILVLPPKGGAQEWIDSAPIIQSGLAEPLIDKITTAVDKTTLTTGDAIENIAKVVTAHL